MARYAVIENGQITSVIAWDGATAYAAPQGATLQLERDALAAGVPYATPPDLTTRAQTAIAANRANITQNGNIATQADAIAAGTGTLTAAQLSTAVRQLATGLAALARNDATAYRELNALIRLATADFDDTAG